MTLHTRLTSLVLTSALVFGTNLAAETPRTVVPAKPPTPIADAVASYAAQQMAANPLQGRPARPPGNHRAPRLLPVLLGAGIGFGFGAYAVHQASEGDTRGTDVMKGGLGMAALGAGIAYVISSR